MNNKDDSASGYAKFRSAALRRLFRSPLVAVASHWVFQSLPYMDKTERWFKIALDFGLTILFTALFSIWLSILASLLIAFLLAHTLNFLFNGHLWGALKHYGFVHVEQEAFTQYEQGVEARLRSESSIMYAIACGSLTRGEWKTSSDLDLRVVRRSGFFNGIRACTSMMKERTRALFTLFPIDIYVLDNFDSLNNLSPDDFPQVLYDSR